MIVSCPACRTRYRYHEPVPDSGAQAVCSSCEGLVPLVAERQAYVVRAQVVAVAAGVPVGVPVGVAAGVGMEEPGRVSGFTTTAFDGVAAADVPVTVPSDQRFEQPVELDSLPVQSVASQGRPIDGFQVEKDASPLDAQPEAAKRSGAARRVLQLLAVLVLAAAGAAAGEYATMVGWLGPVTVHSSVEPVRLGIIGGLLGVLIAWVGIRWTTPKS
jgi:hypothetical protein